MTHHYLHLKNGQRRTARCVHCGYDIRATVDGVCPECGLPEAVQSSRIGEWSACNFCGRRSDVTGPQAEGLGDAFICARCVAICYAEIKKSQTRGGGAGDAGV